MLEFGVAAWNGAINSKQSEKIERVQKVALRLIYGRDKSYRMLLKEANLTKLYDRREKLCLNFARKALKHQFFKNWFLQANPRNPLEKARFYKCISRHKRLKNTPIPYMTELLNKYNGHTG